MAGKEICKICGKEITGTVMEGADNNLVTCVSCHNLRERESMKMKVTDGRLKELINETGLEAHRVYFGTLKKDINHALKELELHRLQHRKRDLMIRKAQLLKQNKALLEKQKGGKQ